MKPKIKGISRAVHNKTHGWIARVYHNGKTYSKLFSDSKFDGKENAFNEAINWRNQKEIELRKPETEAQTELIRTRRIKKPGISRIVRKSEDKVKEEVYIISYKTKSGIQRMSVSINKYGERDAFKRAVEIQRKYNKTSK